MMERSRLCAAARSKAPPARSCCEVAVMRSRVSSAPLPQNGGGWMAIANFTVLAAGGQRAHCSRARPWFKSECVRLLVGSDAEGAAQGRTT